MTIFAWHDAYYAELQTLWALLVVPFAFLAWRVAIPVEPERAVVPRAARFLSLATIAFALETMLDPIATGPLLKSEALRDGVAATLVPFLFVYLGDLRVVLLARAVLRPDEPRARTFGVAAAATAIVPVTTGVLHAGVRALWPDADGQWLWMIYEAGFLVLCVVVGRVVLRREAERDGAAGQAGRAFVGALFGYAAAYYALWLAADVVIVVAGLDVGWALRKVPNQLYYALWVPFAHFRFFSAPPPNARR